MDYFKDISGYFWLVVHRIRIRTAEFCSNAIAQVIIRSKGVKAGNGTVFKGLPWVRRCPMSTITIGADCKFNSLKKSQEMYIFRPCSFVTMNKKAEIIIGDHVGCTSTTFVAASKITIGNHVLLGINTTITDTDFHNSDPYLRVRGGETRPVLIHDNVFVGMNTVILKGVTIGKNSAIGANSVVLTNIPPNSIAMGNPCKVIMKKNLSEKADTVSDDKISTDGNLIS